MKRILLLLSLLPCLVFGQSEKREAKPLLKWKKYTERLQVPFQSGLRADASVVKDSMYTYRDEEKILIEKATYKYDAVGRVIEETSYWDYNKTGSFTHLKEEYKYADTGIYPIEVNYYRWEGDNWIKTSKDVYTNNADGYPIDLREYTYINGEMILMFTTTAGALDDNGKPLYYLFFIVEGGVPLVMKMDIEFDNNYQPLSMTTYEANVEENDWMPFEKIEYTINPETSLREEETHADYNNGQWEPSYNRYYKYDERGELIEEKEIESNGNVWEWLRYKNFYSDNVITKNQTLTNQHIKIRLESNTQLLTVDLGDASKGLLSIVNPSGKTIIQDSLNGQLKTVSMQSFPSGIYFVRVNTPQGTKTEKISLQ